MIKLLKNKDVAVSLLIQIAFSIIAYIVCYNIDYRAGIAAGCLALVLILTYYISTYLRYKKITALSSTVNKLLHGDYSVSFESYAEGELSILQSEIYKMTIRLREQHQKLINDKVYLADSIADISHQIRTPLTSINLVVQFLSEPNLTDERRIELTRELRRLLSRIDWLIVALLKISKLDAGTVKFQRDNLTLKELLDQACSPLLIPFELREQDLIINAEGNFVGDVAWTCEAIGNIVKNCMEHTPAGGKVEIDACENAIYTEIIIKDTGCGIDEEDILHIFERFYKGKDSGDNSFGIGLALARMIITSQNGTLKAENQPSSGAMFTIRFYKGAV